MIVSIIAGILVLEEHVVGLSQQLLNYIRNHNFIVSISGNFFICPCPSPQSLSHYCPLRQAIVSVKKCLALQMLPEEI